MAAPRHSRPDRPSLQRAARRGVDATLRAGAIRYDRARHLPRLIRAVPAEIAKEDTDNARAIIRRLEQALAAERRRGRAGHWTYDINRHIALLQALKAERAALCSANQTPEEAG